MLSDKYTPDSERKHPVSHVRNIPWLVPEAEQRVLEAKTFNTQINVAFQSNTENAATLRTLKKRIMRNLKRIKKTIETDPLGIFFEQNEMIDQYLSKHPRALFKGCHLLAGRLHKMTKGKRVARSVLAFFQKGEPDIPFSLDIYLQSLLEMDEWQYMVVDNDFPVTIVLAGAGSGKTRTVVYWVNSRIHGGYKPHRILLLTFSDNATRVSASRIKAVHEEVITKTFHGFACMSLFQNETHLFKMDGYKILDDLEQKWMVQKILRGLDLSFSLDDALMFLKKITLTGVDADQMTGLSAPLQKFIDVYAKEKKEARLLDFNDMIVRNYIALRDDPAYRSAVSDRYDCLVFDETQDTFEIFINSLKLIYTPKKQLLAVGDPSQRIYSFAGACRNAFKLFRDNFAGELLVLPYNHRSAPDIVTIMDRFIRSNPREIVRPVIPTKKGNQ